MDDRKDSASITILPLTQWRCDMPRAIGEWKVCSKCKEKKHVSEFHKSTNRFDGYSYACISCENARLRKYKSEHRELLRQQDKVYRETEHGRHNAKMRMRAFRERHPGRALEAVKKYYRANKEKCNARRKKWRGTPEGSKKSRLQQHRRRDRVYDSVVDLTSEGISYLLEFQANRCGKCGRKFTDDLVYSLDHILPLSLGGNLTITNVQLLCRSCNSSKGIKSTRYIPELPENLTIKEVDPLYRV